MTAGVTKKATNKFVTVMAGLFRLHAMNAFLSLRVQNVK